MTQLLALLALYATATAGVSAAPPVAPQAPEALPNFSGRWLPVLDEWEGIERMLEIQEASWLYRQAVGRVAVAEVISHANGEMHIEMDVPLPVHPQHLHLDGVEREQVTPLGRRARGRHTWEKDGVLLHTLRMQRSDGAPYTVTVRRGLSPDGTTMELDIHVALPDSEEHRARQVYRRARARSSR